MMFWSVNDWHVRRNVECHLFYMTIHIHDCPILGFIMLLFSVALIIYVFEFHKDEILWDHLSFLNVKQCILIDKVLFFRLRRLIAHAIHLLRSLVYIDHESTRWVFDVTVPVKLDITLLYRIIMVGLGVNETGRAGIDVFKDTVVFTLVP